MLSYDPVTGIFRWRYLQGSGRKKSGEQAGYLRRGYVVIRVDGADYKAHRLAWLYVHGEWPPDEVDHINRCRSDNRLDNLRVVTKAENRQNEDGPMANNKLGVRGVHLSPSGKYIAKIAANKRWFYLGSFDTVEEASAAYETARSRLHPFSPAASNRLGSAEKHIQAMGRSRSSSPIAT